MATVGLILGVAFIAVCAAELVRGQCRRMLAQPHQVSRVRVAASAAASAMAEAAVNAVSDVAQTASDLRSPSPAMADAA